MPSTNFEAAAFLSILLRIWEGQGHQLGVDQHLRIWHLLKGHEQIKPEELKLILAPVLGYNAQLQANFYKVFDDALEIYELELKAHEGRAQEIASQRLIERWQARITQTLQGLASFVTNQPLKFLTLLVVLIGAVFFWRWWNDADFRPDVTIPIQYQEEATQQVVRLGLTGPWARETLRIERKHVSKERQKCNFAKSNHFWSS